MKSKQYPVDWERIARSVKEASDWCCEICGAHHDMPPYVLTVHHVDYNPMNCDSNNLVALCQRCHLKVQGWRVQPLNRDQLLKRAKSEGRQLQIF